MRFEVINGVIEGVTPHERFVSWRITTFEANDGQIQLFGNGSHGGVEQRGEGMGGVDDEVVCRVSSKIPSWRHDPCLPLPGSHVYIRFAGHWPRVE